jgi:alkanesulfonate monooxygenase SsuD/methylene tetrahydromethanopterin reductase-like flavin-dependent oxidoreductase (luciferase family)
MVAVERLALGIDPNSVLSVADMVECARLAEARSFAATWVAEGRRGDVFAVLTALALNTGKIRLGAGIIPVLVRSPWVVTIGTAVVDEVSAQRFMLGLGAGHKRSRTCSPVIGKVLRAAPLLRIQCTEY